ncbi:VCBS repeat-containing protein [Heliobacterium undosum]|uniref:VCBS repeat-containing protein n=2 Tax=Heliomicrobium undosum TaxID=121734 RepID=A0A845L5I2_9FIRM|nr:VCBS repeat-containing protein [Heliomicrobium undosum]
MPGIILDVRFGDVNGDRIPDRVYLTGHRPDPQSPFVDRITLMIQDGRTMGTYPIPLRTNAGYNPTLFLGDFTGDGVMDIQVSIDSGGSGALTFEYIYSFLNNRPRLLFDDEQFNQFFQYDVNYRDMYKVDVVSKSLQKTFTIDIRYKGPEYLAEIYNPDGTLKAPIEGFVVGISGLYPVDFDRNGVYELLAFQGIAGRYNADRIGYVLTALKWDGSRFAVMNQWVAIFGG